MLRFVLAAAALSAPQTAGDMPRIDPGAAATDFCPETPMSQARKMGERATDAIPLSELPPAQMFLAVDRRVDGCPAPVVVKYGVGKP